MPFPALLLTWLESLGRAEPLHRGRRRGQPHGAVRLAAAVGPERRPRALHDRDPEVREPPGAGADSEL